jgi:NADH dehydrogenase
MKPDLSVKAERSLIGLGVRTRTGVQVTAIDAEGVSVRTTNGPERILCRTVLWAAGVRASSMGRQVGEVDSSGRVKVLPDLTVPNHPEIFVIGDAALCLQNGEHLPGTSPVAMQQGWYVGKVIAARLQGRDAAPFHFIDKGTMATIGRKAAVCDLGFVRFGGTLAWLAWLFLHLLYLVTFRSRVLVALQWAFQYITFNRGARLITR